MIDMVNWGRVLFASGVGTLLVVAVAVAVLLW